MKPNKSERARLVREMSQYMLDQGEHCTRETLLLQFTQNEVDTYSAEARIAANELSKRAA